MNEVKYQFVITDKISNKVYRESELFDDYDECEFFMENSLKTLWNYKYSGEVNFIGVEK